jgi:hypothetical protein
MVTRRSCSFLAVMPGSVSSHLSGDNYFCLWHRRRAQHVFKRRQRRFIPLRDSRAMTCLRFQLE